MEIGHQFELHQGVKSWENFLSKFLFNFKCSFTTNQVGMCPPRKSIHENLEISIVSWGSGSLSEINSPFFSWVIPLMWRSDHCAFLWILFVLSQAVLSDMLSSSCKLGPIIYFCVHWRVASPHPISAVVEVLSVYRRVSRI